MSVLGNVNRSATGRRRKSPKARLVGTATVLILLAVFVAPAFAQANLSWTSGIGIDLNGGQPLASIDCTSATQCVAVDAASQAVVFNPASPGSPAISAIGGGNSLSNVVCLPGGAQCVALDGTAGQEITFTPGGSAAEPEEIDTTTVSSISCPSASQCTAVDTAGDEVTFDPSSVTSPPTPHAIGTSAIDGESPTVSCPSATQCTAVDYTGSAVTFDPQDGSITDALATVDSGFNANPDDDALFGVDCPTTNECVAADGGGYEVTFSPSSPGTATHYGVDTGNGLNGIACASSTQCSVVGQNGSEAEFDPTSPSTTTVAATIDTGQTPSAVACPGTGQCTAVDGVGNAITFDPTSPSGAAATDIDPGNSLYDVSCPLTTECAAVDGAGQEVTFDPSLSSDSAIQGSASTHVIDGGETLYGISCPSSTQCTAVDRGGDQVTFNPETGTPVSAPMLVDDVPTFDHVSCFSPSECSAVDESGQEVTWNPMTGAVTGGAPSVVDSGHPLYSVSCPSAAECATVDGSGQEVAYDPETGAVINSVHDIDGTQAFYSVFCTSTSECTAGDNAGQVVSYDPQTGAITTPLTRVDGGRFLLGIACPSASLCVAVDQDGTVVGGDPAIPADWSSTVVSGEGTMDGVWCPSTTECVGVDIAGNVTVGTGTAGPVPVDTGAPTIAGSPVQGQTLTLTHGTWSNGPTGYTDQWEDCNASGNSCVAISGATGGSYALTATDVGSTIRVSEVASNGSGNGTATVSAATAVVTAPASGTPSGGTPSGGVPVSSSLPTISGGVVQGDTLTESHGQWSNSPSIYSYQWERCNSGASGCVAIAGAIGQTYTLVAADVDSTIRVVETASNGYGSGAPSTSIATLQIQPVATPSKVSAPNTKLAAKQISSKHRTATFRFAATGKATRFQCALVLEPKHKGAKAPKPVYVACGTKKTYKHLRVGSYELYARAVGPGGTDKTPATFRFKIS